MALTAQRIEKDLADLWKVLPGDEEKNLGFQRVYTTNLVAYAENPADAFRVERTLHHLAEAHPGRYLMVRPGDSEAEEPLPTVTPMVSGHCLLSHDFGKKVCCELVQLLARPDAQEHLYGLAFSCLLPDLPVEFWWPGDLAPRHSFFARMAGEATRVWVDSSRFNGFLNPLVSLAANWKGNYARTLLGDLNWVRINRWRALIAELFDGEWSPYLSRISEVKIKYGAPGQPARPFYMACWLAAQMGWRYTGPRISGAPRDLKFTGPQGEIAVKLEPVPVQDELKDRIYSVSLTTGGDKPGLFTVDRGQDPFSVKALAQAGNRTTFARTVTFEHLHTYELLSLGMRHLETDSAFEKVMKIAGTILEKGVS
jgi:hypothetical protein